MISQKNLISGLTRMLLIASLATACTKKSAENEKSEANAQTAKAKQLQAELSSDLEKLKKDREELGLQILQFTADKDNWEKNRAHEETVLSELTLAIADKRAQILELDNKIAQTKATIESEQVRINTEKASILADRAAAEAELKAAREQAAHQFEAKIHTANEVLAKNQARETQLIADQKTLDALVEESNKIMAENSELKAKLDSDRVQLSETIKNYRALFSKNGHDGVFDKLQSNKEMYFLVTISGYGSYQYADQIREGLAKLNENEIANYKVSKRVKTASSGEVQDKFILKTTPSEMRKFRDHQNMKLQLEAEKGTAVQETQLFVIVRPIEKVRTGVKIQVFGTDKFGFEDRNVDLKYHFPQARTNDNKLFAMEDINLDNPGTFGFTDSENRRCEMFDLECMKVIRNNKVLDIVNTVIRPSGNGNHKFLASYKDVLIEALVASTAQLTLDYDLYDKKVIEIGYRVGTGSYGKLDKQALAAKFPLIGKVLDLEAKRQPIISSIEMSYVVAMVDEVGTSNDNPLDTYQHLLSGFAGNKNTRLFSTALRRGEIEIELPIQNLKKTVTDFPDLGLSNFKPIAVAPVKPLEPKLPNDRVKTNRAAWEDYDKKLTTYSELVEKYEEDVRQEMITEFNKRVVKTIGAQGVLLEALTK